jgi:hypothetical protein
MPTGTGDFVLTGARLGKCVFPGGVNNFMSIYSLVSEYSVYHSYKHSSLVVQRLAS